MDQHQQPQKKKMAATRVLGLISKIGAKLFDNNKTAWGHCGNMLTPALCAWHKRVYTFKMFFFSNLKHLS